MNSCPFLVIIFLTILSCQNNTKTPQKSKSIDDCYNTASNYSIYVVRDYYDSNKFDAANIVVAEKEVSYSINEPISFKCLYCEGSNIKLLAKDSVNLCLKITDSLLIKNFYTSISKINFEKEQSKTAKIPSHGSYITIMIRFAKNETEKTYGFSFFSGEIDTIYSEELLKFKNLVLENLDSAIYKNRKQKLLPLINFQIKNGEVLSSKFKVMNKLPTNIVMLPPSHNQTNH